MHILHLNQRNQRSQILFQYLRDKEKKRKKGAQKKKGGGGVKIQPFHLTWIRPCSSWHKRTAGRNLVVHRHGTTLRQTVQRYRCLLYFSLFFSHFDIKAGKSPENIVGKEAFHSCLLLCPCQIVDGYCVLFIAFKPILHIKHVLLKI